MRNLKIIVAVMFVASLCMVSTASAKKFTAGPGPAGAPQLTVDPATGNASMTASPGITTWELKSTGGIFDCTNKNDAAFDPFFGTCTPEKIFTTWPAGSESLDFGPVVPAGTTAAAMLADFEIDGSLVGGGGLDRDVADAPYLNAGIIPEPSSAALLGLGLLGLLGIRRKK